MKWVELIGTHVNTDHIETFTWMDGYLRIYFHRDRNPADLKDPDRELYLRLCRGLGIRPHEEAGINE